MATFPILKTGAVAQYPLACGVRFSTQAVRFMDGSQQRFRLIGTGLRRWTMKLDLLDEQELGAVIAFVEQQGSAVFAFTDPADGRQRCNLRDLRRAIRRHDERRNEEGRRRS